MNKNQKYIFAIFIAIIVSVTSLSSISAATYNFRDKSTWATVGLGSSGGFVGAVQSDLWATDYQTATGAVDHNFGFYTVSPNCLCSMWRYFRICFQ